MDGNFPFLLRLSGGAVTAVVTKLEEVKMNCFMVLETTQSNLGCPIIK